MKPSCCTNNDSYTFHAGIAFIKIIYMSIRTGLTAAEAVQLIQSGNRVFIHGSAATPVTLIKALQQRYAELDDVELVSITSMGEVDFNQPHFHGHFFFNSLFVSANTRDVCNSENGDYV